MREMETSLADHHKFHVISHKLQTELLHVPSCGEIKDVELAGVRLEHFLHSKPVESSGSCFSRVRGLFGSLCWDQTDGSFHGLKFFITPSLVEVTWEITQERRTNVKKQRVENVFIQKNPKPTKPQSLRCPD